MLALPIELSPQPATIARSQATRKTIAGPSQVKSIRDPPSLGAKPKAAQGTSTTDKVKF